MSEDKKISAIRETCVLVSFHGGFYTWKRRDRKAEREYTQTKGLNGNPFETKKNLFEGADNLLTTAKSLITEARKFHYDHTNPSPYEGEAFLRNVLIVQYKAGMLNFQHRLEALNAQIESEWPTMLAHAKGFYGNDFTLADYPSIDTVKAGNYLTTVFKPIPAGQNIILDGVDAQLRDEIAGDIDNTLRDAYKAANLEAWSRLLKIIENAKDNLAKMSSLDGRFRSEWYDNLAGLLPLMTGLNITDDPDLTRLSQEAEALLSVSKDVLEEEPDMREDLADKATKIYDEMSGLFASFGGK